MNGKHIALFYIASFILFIASAICNIMVLAVMVVLAQMGMLIYIIRHYQLKQCARKENMEAVARELELKQKKEKEAELCKKTEEKIAAIPKYPITINKDAPRLKRQKLMEMPEIKISPMSKNFDCESKLGDFISLDIETTGLKSSSERIIKISAIRYIGFKPIACFDTYVNPLRPIPPEASNVNHITDDMVADAPTISEISESFISFLGKLPIVGYNIAFDLRFLYCSGINLIGKHRIYDVYQAVKKFKLETYDNKLETVAEYSGLHCNFHDSLDDAYATEWVLEYLYDI